MTSPDGWAWDPPAADVRCPFSGGGAGRWVVAWRCHLTAGHDGNHELRAEPDE